MEANLSKKQRKLFRKQEKMEIRLQTLKTARRSKIITYSIIILFIFAIGIFLYARTIPPTDAPMIQIIPKSVDFGPVSQRAGTTSTEVTISNNGDKPLVLNNLDTSCGCTSAAIIYKGVESPKFSMAMHGTNPRDWTQVIPPGDSAQLKIIYDPNVHKDMRGPATRFVYLYSNDPRNSKQSVRVSLVQVD